MAFDDRAVFKAAFEGAYNKSKFRLRDRALVRDALASPYLLDLVHDAFGDKLPNEEPVGEFGDGQLFNIIADRIGKWFMWIIEHRDEVLDFIRQIVDMFI